MKILLLHPRKSSLGGWEESVYTTFLQCGDTVTSFDYRHVAMTLRKTNPEYTIEYIIDFLKREIVNIIETVKPDCIYVSKGELLLEPILERIRKFSIPLINWIGDGMWIYDFIVRVAPYYTLFFTFDLETVRHLQEHTIYSAKYLPLAFDASARHCAEIKAPEDFTSDICFVGSPTPERVAMFKCLPIKKYSIKIWGPEQWKKADLKSCFQGRPLVGDQLYAAYKQATMVINLHYGFQNSNCPYYSGINHRVFEAGGTGTFLLTDWKDDMAHTFENNLCTFSSADELAEKIDLYMSDTKSRREKADTFQKEILEHHTMVHRIQTIKDWLKEV